MKKKLFYLNTISSLLLQIITIVSGFILPRYILRFYGSSVNGLVSSISQFLGFISFLQLGVGAVVQTSWYKPLANGDTELRDKIYKSANKFFRLIAIIFVFYTIVLAFLYPLRVLSEYDYWFTLLMVFTISISLFAQYFFGITNQLLLFADQKSYLYSFLQVGIVIANVGLSIILMYSNMSILLVKLLTSILFSICPILLYFIVKKNYKINKKVFISEEPIKQKWNGLAQHLSSVVMDNTDVIILTLFSTLTNVSIYYVYHLVVYGIRQLLTSMTTGFQSLIGNTYATDENECKSVFNRFEMKFNYLVTFVFSCSIVLICPFVLTYTDGITDANYNVPIFGVLMVIAFAIYCYRLPYYNLIKAAGHYKETQNSAIIEMIINLVISIVLVIFIGLEGIAIGTLCATAYRTIYLIIYSKCKIFNEKPYGSLLYIVFGLLLFAIGIIYYFYFYQPIELGYLNWIKYAFIVSIIYFVLITLVFALCIFIKKIKLKAKNQSI